MRPTILLRNSLLATLLMTTFAYSKTTVEYKILEKSCSDKTLVYSKGPDGKMFQAGETLDGYCKGFLEGVFDSMVQSKEICFNVEGKSPETFDVNYLLSVVTFHFKKQPSDEAVTVVRAAYKNAFSCNK